MHSFTRKLLACLFGSLLLPAMCVAQQAAANTTAQSDGSAPLSDRERMLLDRIAHLEERVEALETKLAGQDAPSSVTATAHLPVDPPQAPGQSVAPADPSAGQTSSGVLASQAKPAQIPPPPSFLGGTTLNVGIDTYYGYNFNDPIGRVNLLRAYDVSSNAISLNQASLILDNQPDLTSGKRWGFRLDFQYGQATETLQGNPANEPRPEIYRNVFQAYGTYVLPIGKGLAVDFGKFASSLGYENNYTKDQMNYSRSFWFNFLPFYHMGARLNYKFSDKFAVNYWLVNGTQQSEPFNGYKDELFGAVITPRTNLSWSVNYYLGQEHPDVTYFPNGGAPANAPTVQGVPFEPVQNPANGKLHIFDSYVNWQASSKWTFAGEADDEIERLLVKSPPSHTDGGALYAQYQVTPKLSFAARGEYLSDRGGLFSGVTQAIKETTINTKYQAADGFDIFAEWRHDFSNQPYFYSDTLGLLKRGQTTATLGLVWWWGGKQGAW